MKYFLIVLGVISSLGILAQSDWKASDLVGTYVIKNVSQPPSELDTVRQFEPPPGIDLHIKVQVANNFSNVEYLKMRRFKHFKIKGSTCTLDYGLNTDYPSYYGKYEISGDTLIMRCDHYIQHFNKSADKRRVKTPYKAVFRWIIQEDGTLKVYEWEYWTKKED